MAKTNPLEFLQEVRQETMITTVMVLLMVVLASIFFLIVDAVLKWGVEKVLFGM